MPRIPGRSGPFLSLIFRVTLGALLTLLTTAALAEAQPLAGRVIDPDARPVAGADVLVVRGNQVVAMAKTRADGGFGPLAIAPGEYDIVASAPGLRSRSTPVIVKSGAETSIELKLAVTAVHESIVVSATQVEQPLTRATDSVTVITRADIERKQIETVPDALEVRADRARLRQVVTNALDNAVRHSPEGGRVRVTGAVTGDRWRLDIADEGPGIALADRERAFERFGTLTSPDGDTGGTGLGLAIARWVAGLHGGTVRFLEPPSGTGGASPFERAQ